MILSIVPESPVQVMADVQVLPLIVFALLIGIGILMAKEEGTPVAKIFDSGAVIMQKVTMLVMELTPFGVFALMAWVAGVLGLDALQSLAQLVGLNYLGCLLIIFGMYPLMIRFLAKVPVVGFFRGMIDAMAVSYSTASSNNRGRTGRVLAGLSLASGVSSPSGMRKERLRAWPAANSREACP